MKHDVAAEEGLLHAWTASVAAARRCCCRSQCPDGRPRPPRRHFCDRKIELWHGLARVRQQQIEHVVLVVRIQQGRGGQSGAGESMWGSPLPSLPPSGARMHMHVAPHRGRVRGEGGGEGPNQRTSRLLLHLQPPRNSEGRQASASARPAACASASRGTLWWGNRCRSGGSRGGSGGGGQWTAPAWA